MLRWIWRPALILLVCGTIGWWLLHYEPRRNRPTPPEPAPVATAPKAPEPRAWRPREAVEPAPGCAPEADQRCVDGDAWWVDGCGVTYARAEDCEGLCTDGVCDPPPTLDCGGESVLGRCDGHTARGCDGGRPFAVDCSAAGLSCVITEAGPACRAPADICDPEALPPRCAGSRLLVCEGGQRRAVDCRAYGGICGEPPGGGAARCIQLPPPVTPADCDDPCGCPSADGDEVCDGRDNDGDGWIDESGECAAIDLVAFVVVDEAGQGSYSREDIDAEIAGLERLFAREDDYGLAFRLVEVVRLRQPQWLELDNTELDEVVRSGAVASRSGDFYVPILFTERLLVDGVPRPGLSTVPNGSCGGQRRIPGSQPPLGLVALGKRRWNTTLAHELGHFLGLCHTHGDHPSAIVAIDPGDGDEARACQPPCAVDDDGLCDTPPDSGPPVCRVDLECTATCDDGASPDPTNVMGYYPQCRTGFTEQQALLMRQSLALRRGWHRCVMGEGCSCDLVDGGCPEGMSCRRYSREDGPYLRCGLDGPAVPGGVCSGGQDCSRGAQCIGQPDADPRCVRPCNDATPGCQCTEVGGVDHPICIDDLRRDP